MSREPWNWNKEDLDALIGQAESVRLDFKESKLLSQPHERIVDNLSREISAFANTEGGTIVIGIVERHEGKTRIADRFDDGVDIKVWSPERVQQMCESNISPPLRGLRVKAIPLNDMRTRHAVVIHVPASTTAHQAHDRRYYGRSEYESKALLDHEVRLLMFRGKAPNAVVKVTNCHKRIVKQSTDHVNSGMVQDGNTLQSLATYFFNLSVENVGEINITEFKVVISFFPEGIGELRTLSRAYKDGWPESAPGVYAINEAPPERHMKVNVFPADTFDVTPIQTEPMSIESLRDTGLTLHWALHLSNVAPTSGTIDLVAMFEQAKVVE